MIQVGTTVKFLDDLGIPFAKCIKIKGEKKSAGVGDIILVVIPKIKKKKFKGLMKNIRYRKKFRSGSMHRALVVMTKKYIVREDGVRLGYDENIVVFINKRKRPYFKHFYGPMMHEFYYTHKYVVAKAYQIY